MSTPLPTSPPDFAVIASTVDIGLGVKEAWAKIGVFADAGKFLNVPCKLISGTGGVGSARQIGDAIIEVMVSAGDSSYAYAQNYGPMAEYAYHGSVVVKAVGAGACQLTYTVLYDQSLMDDAKRASEHVRIKGRFQGAAEAMKRAAEI